MASTADGRKSLLQPLFDVPYPLSDDPALRVYSIMHHLEGLIAEHGYFPLGYVRLNLDSNLAVPGAGSADIKKLD